ncbi:MULTISPECIES: V-type ATP synthase subunit E [Anaerococcus]|uniref:V-type ATP synthase subunit E n=1 Tax=Anaerococcus TaxID=165779 RepID=UPI001AE3C5E8|nr:MULTISPECIES: ATPase [Anaerococcus]MBP2069609.1 V/A-type H+-transporting ATPase subunit E [Anaerococcus nagyae]MDU1828427.1 ATPase [Anaerococcus sp.]MDU1864750.1 ATPase [Anaerococcus sp.]MDU2565461.1 ATPase [Anaerococcus sp.]
MLDLNAKLSTFRKMVWDEEKARSEEQLYNSTNINSQQIEEKKQKLEKDLKNTLESRKSFATIRGNERIAKLEEEQKTNFYAHKEFLLNELVGEIKEKLIEYTKTDEYKNSLSTNIEKKLEELNESSDNFEILVRKEDMNLISYPHLGHLDEKYIGGFILKSIDGSYQYNYTYLKKIEEEKYDIGRTLYNLFEKESFNESNN